MVALLVAWIRADAELFRERQHPVLGRADPLPTELDDRAVRERVILGPATHTIARLQHHHTATLSPQLARGSQPGEPGPDDDDITF